VVTVTEADLPAGRRSRILEETGRLLGITKEEIESTIRSKTRDATPFTPVTIKEDVPREVALRLEEQSWGLPGVNVRVATIREYLDGPVFAHVMGYMMLPTDEEYTSRYRPEGYEPDQRVGAAGVEQIYEAELHGKPGARLFEVDAAGRPLRDIQERASDPGQRLVLTLDAELQRQVHGLIEGRLAPGTSGVGIVMDPRNGEVLAMVSLPSYDPNVFAQPTRDAEISKLLQDPGLPLFHRAVAGQYPPGSTFKLITGLAALEERIVTRDTRVNCAGGLRIPNPYDPRQSTWLPDWAPLGILDFVQGLAQSCNVYFYTLGGGYEKIEGLGSERLGRYARRLGYGELTGIDLPSEAAGQVPSAEWKAANFAEAWMPGDTYNMSIGQGFVLATPLQVANLTNAVATGGTFYRPRLMRGVLDAEGQSVREMAPSLLRRVTLRPDTLSPVRDGMVAALGTTQASPFRIQGLNVAGKTGTAEFAGPKNAQGIGPTHGWFTAYAPAENPRVSVTVFIERGGGPGDALPLAMDVLRAYFARYP
jgi:penicillin-binding protein 2